MQMAGGARIVVKESLSRRVWEKDCPAVLNENVQGYSIDQRLLSVLRSGSKQKSMRAIRDRAT